MLPLTFAAAVGWLLLVDRFLAVMVPGMEGTAAVWVVLVGLLLVMPLLAGLLVAGWRQGAPGRIGTLALAGASGGALNWLNVLVLYAWERAFFPGRDLASSSVDPWDAADVIVMPALVGAILGTAGWWLWDLLVHRGPSLRPHPG